MDFKLCEKHQTGLVEHKTKIKEWKLCANGLYRNVYKTSKTWNCPGKLRILTKPTEMTVGKSDQKIKSSPAKLFSIFTKRKR